MQLNLLYLTSTYTVRGTCNPVTLKESLHIFKETKLTLLSGLMLNNSVLAQWRYEAKNIFISVGRILFIPAVVKPLKYLCHYLLSSCFLLLATYLN